MHYVIFIALIVYYKQEIINLIIISSVVFIFYILCLILSNKKEIVIDNSIRKVSGPSRVNKLEKNRPKLMGSEIPTKGLIIKSPHIDKILSGSKTWEMRASNTKQRGCIALIKKGTGQIVGLAKLVDTKGPLSYQQKLDNIDKHQISLERLKTGETEKWNVAWVLEDVINLKTPISYKHPNGAVIWVNLESNTRNEIAAYLKQS